MSEVKTIRINKVLRELNISLDRAVEQLGEHGFDIEARPTSKISQAEYQLLVDAFQTDRNKKEASEEVSEEKRKEKEAIRQRIEEEQEAKTQVVQARTELEGLRQVGKIDLEPKAKPKAEVKVEKSTETPKAEPTKTEEPVAEPVAKPTPEKPTEQKQAEPEKIATADTEKVTTQYKKLTGLKIAGDKIDLKKFEKKETKPSADNNDRKRRRKRITKNTGPGGGQQNKPKPKRQNQPTHEEPSDEEIQKQIRETLEKLQGKTTKSKGAKYRREKRDSHRQKSEEDAAQVEADSKLLKVTEFVTVGEIATMMDISSTEIISACMTLGIMVTMNQRLDAETLSIVAEEFGYTVEFVTADIEETIDEPEDNPDDLVTRAPIVTVMGHVDHGKTSLLDYIRKTNVTADESGGITQHIGAYSVILESGQKITFLDTPGHEAFTAMRARGTQVTDLVIIVIAADDDIMPQTKEAISHAQAASVPIVFAINKIDSPNANPDKIKEGLSAMNLLVEDWGGKIQSHDVSAKQGTGISELLEKVMLESELLELKANPSKAAQGTVVEAFLDKGRGYVSTILVQAGTLRIGDYILAGQHSGKVRAMQDERGKEVSEAGPSTPVSLLGLDGAPTAGDRFNVFAEEKEAKQIAAKRTQLVREQSVRTQRHITLDEIGRRIALGDFKELNIILKGDVDGSVEALTDSFQKLSTEEIQVNIIHKGVGAITESDVLLASASDAIIVGFNVRPVGTARQLAEKEEIDVRSYSIIYDAINDLKDAMEGLLSPDMKEEVQGNVEIRETYKISRVGTIAGCMVMDGKITRNSMVRIVREGVVVYTGALASLKRFKDDVKEVTKGYDCGLQIKDYNDIKIGDTIEAYIEIAVKKKLK
ncbi:MAG: translation initiation factor IF-2 [Flavobacteriaceae bacterium TMED81]|nr:MAG: translation initiation factor IF-2 [Flavobacteriaceae bacterium TMED81]